MLNAIICTDFLDCAENLRHVSSIFNRIGNSILASEFSYTLELVQRLFFLGIDPLLCFPITLSLERCASQRSLLVVDPEFISCWSCERDSKLLYNIPRTDIQTKNVVPDLSSSPTAVLLSTASFLFDTVYARNCFAQQLFLEDTPARIPVALLHGIRQLQTLRSQLSAISSTGHSLDNTFSLPHTRFDYTSTTQAQLDILHTRFALWCSQGSFHIQTEMTHLDELTHLLAWLSSRFSNALQSLHVQKIFSLSALPSSNQSMSSVSSFTSESSSSF